jgi:hypothetical protein
MLKTYVATVSGDRIQWDEGEDPALREPTKVIVTILQSAAPKQRVLPRSDGVAAAAILAEIAAKGGISAFGDPLEWQREVRKDRPLPGREDE